jgi:hypothetical protein
MTQHLYKGWSIDHFAQFQTLHPPRHIEREGNNLLRYSGDEPLSYGQFLADIAPRIPLDLRYASFCRRLDAALARAA